MNCLDNNEKFMSDLNNKNISVSFMPREIDIEITSFCNFRCTMCPHSLIGNINSKHISIEKLKKLDNIFMNCKRVMIQGDGEPLLHPNFVEITKYIRSFGCKMCTTTNLSLLTEETAKILASEYELVTVSCDAGNKKTYEMIRRNASFETFANNLELLMNYANPGNVVINAVIMKQNIDYLDELLKFLSGIGVHKVVFSNLLSTQYLKNENDNVRCLGRYAVEKLREAEELAHQLKIDLLINWDYLSLIDDCEMPDNDENERAFSEVEINAFNKEYIKLRTINSNVLIGSGKYHCEGICKNLLEKIYIDVNGNMTLCCYGKLQPIGNVFDDDFDEVWNGKIYQDCRKRFFKGELPNFCIGCRYAMISTKMPMQRYPFKIIDMDSAFGDDKYFWENR